jgi:hypothetical protein
MRVGHADKAIYGFGELKGAGRKKGSAHRSITVLWELP